MSSIKKLLFAGTTLSIVLLAACGGTSPTAAPVATSAPAATAAPKAAEATKPADKPAAGAKQITVWYQFDEKNTDPKYDERDSAAWLRKTLPLFNTEMAGKYTLVNQPQAFDKMGLLVVQAVQGGGEIPDVMTSASGGLSGLLKNGTLTDLTDWIKAQSWFATLDPNSVAACTGPDGKIYCVPTVSSPILVYYWVDYFPGGFPKTTDELVKVAADLKAKKVSALTYFGSTDFGGNAVGRYFYTAVASFGGKFDDGKGQMKLNTPENIAALTWMRDVAVKGYNPETVFAGKFQEEESFKDASAAAFPTGLFGYRYVNPLTSPKGTKYETKTSKDMIDAINAGEVKLASFPAGPGKTSGCGTDYGTLIIPKGAKNLEGAQAYINWLMDPKQNAEYVFGPGGGIPTSSATAKDPLFSTSFYKQGIAATTGLCTTWYGSLTNTPDAAKIIATAIYNIIKGDVKSDIATVLTKAETEYNKANQ